jgi:hypothetical protein
MIPVVANGPKGKIRWFYVQKRGQCFRQHVWSINTNSNLMIPCASEEVVDQRFTECDW